MWWWERRRSMVLDASLAAVSAAECGAEGVKFAWEAGLPVAVGVVFGVLAGAVLLLRRRWPIAVVLVAIAITPAEMGFLLSVVGLYTLAASEVPRRITGVLAAMSVAGLLIVTFLRMHHEMNANTGHAEVWLVSLVAVLMSLGITGPPVLLGLYVGARRRLVESLRERAAGLERELSLLADRAEERAEWARGEERTRIARDMHDVVAHRVSLMVVHAAALEAVAVKDPDKAVRNAALVGDMGRQALTELREMLGVLRSDAIAPGDASAAASSSAAAARPGRSHGAAVAVEEENGGPCLDDLEELIGESRAAGMRVELTVDGERGSYAPQVEQTLYRVVQEALTNVHKHAPGASATVRLAHREGGEVAVLVVNGPSEVGSRNAGLPSGGNGLIGMKERVAGLGGGFVSGPTDEGGFRVSAVLQGAPQAL
ncbi:sensor histidine kinase [Streptomyces coryli]|uniref:sensor histidine kinase n=1 Tax=Streptomyces coryli TaxID=1128680 RepID=UPI0030B8D53F